MNAESFNQLINGSTPVIVDFYAENCPPCEVMFQILEQIKSVIGDRVNLIKIDIQKLPEDAEPYRVLSIPTLIIFKEGKVMWKHSGVVPADKLKKNILAFA